jgi:rubrerythrin
MGISFNADETFEIAEQIERNGADFYRRAAKNMASAETAQLLSNLAAEEEEHERIFVEMRKGLSSYEREDTAFDPEGEEGLYIKALADACVFDMNEDPSRRFKGKETIREILRLAIGFEKDSVVFYLGMMEKIPEELGRDRINGIIKEEMSHITSLSRELAKGTR